MNTYTKIPPHERMLIIAKVYHNMWYDNDRFNMVMDLVDNWDMNPIKEAKFLNDIMDGTEFEIKNNK
jgi:hypothetical protein